MASDTRDYVLPEHILHQHGERIAVLEASDKSRAVMMEKFDGKLDGLKENIDDRFTAMQERFDEKVDEVLKNQHQQKGTIGGVVLVVSAIGTVLVIFKDWILRHFS